jgi:hypothetical protein
MRNSEGVSYSDSATDTMLRYLNFGLGGDVLKVPYYPGPCQKLRLPNVTCRYRIIAMCWRNHRFRKDLFSWDSQNISATGAYCQLDTIQH